MQLLTTTQSLVLMAITWKVRLDRKRGGRGLVTVTAASIAEFLSEKFKADASSRAASNALRALTEFGYITRHESVREGFKTVYAYGLPGSSESVPVVFLEREPVTSEESAESSTTPVRSSAVSSTTPISKCLTTKSPISDVATERTEPSTARPPSATYRSSGLRSEVPIGTRSLAEIASMLNGGELPPIVRDADGFIVRPNP